MAVRDVVAIHNGLDVGGEGVDDDAHAMINNDHVIANKEGEERREEEKESYCYGAA